MEHLVRIPAAIQKGNLPYNSATKIAYIYRDIMQMIDREKERKLYQTFIDNGTWITTTLSLWWGMGQLDQSTSEAHKNWMELVPTSILKVWDPEKDDRLKSPSSEDFEAFRGAAVGLAQLAKRMHDMGVNIMAGSDSANPMVVPGYGLQKELQLLVAGGFSPLEAIQLATVKPAKFMRRSEIGTIAIEAIADLVILNENPLVDISNISSIDGVLLKGEYLNRVKLDELLDQAKSLADQR